MKHVVGFSGGIDSQACALWVRNRFPAEDIILLNSNAGGNEHPITEEFVREYSEKVFPVTVVTPLISDMWKTPGFAEKRGLDGSATLTFSLMAEIKGRFPSRTAQFCTEKLKIVPSVRWCQENLTGEEYVRYSGVRWDESEKRRKVSFHEWDDTFDCEVRRPIADWNKQMCFDYVRAHGEPVNPLYSLGFDRVGCAPCINSGKEDIRRWADRFPEMIAKIRDWEKQVGSTFFAPCVPGMAPKTSPRSGKLELFNWIDEVVEWSKTDHGGYQFNILKSLERPACESKFGLCE